MALTYLKRGHGKERGGDSLLSLECLVFHTSLIIPNTSHSFNPLLRGQEPGIGWGVREKEPKEYRGK